MEMQQSEGGERERERWEEKREKLLANVGRGNKSQTVAVEHRGGVFPRNVASGAVGGEETGRWEAELRLKCNRMFRKHVGSRASLNVWGLLLLAASDVTKALRSNPKYREAFIFEKHRPNQTARVAESTGDAG